MKTKQDYDYGAKTRLWLIDKQDYGKQDYEAKPDLAFVAWAWKGKWGFCHEWGEPGNYMLWGSDWWWCAAVKRKTGDMSEPNVRGEKTWPETITRKHNDLKIRILKHKSWKYLDVHL